MRGNTPGLPDPRRRLIFLLVVLSLAFGGVVARLTVLQAIDSHRYSEFGMSQRMHSIVLPAARGAIVDRNGAGLALSTRRRTVWANPQVVRDPVAGARALAPLLDMPEMEIRERLTTSAAFVYLARKVEDPVADKVEALHLPGVSLLEEPKRVEPAGPLAAPVLGKVGLDEQGLSGLELQFQHQLQGRPGQLIVERDPRGNDIAAGIHELRSPVAGNKLVLTIDRSMQYEAERVLAEQIVTTKAKGGIAMVMDVQTGEIRAMANLAAGTGNAPPAPSPDNMAVTKVYEPGSVNKMITVAAGLEEGVIRPSDTFVVPDTINVADTTFHDAEEHDTERMTVSDIVAESSNVGTIMVGRKLGKERIDRFLRAFGLADRTSLDFPGESAGLLPELGKWSGTSMATVPVGQGVAVTALQMLVAYNTVANDGVYVGPSLVKQVVDAQNRVRDTPPASSRRIVSSATARELTEMLEQVVEGGTGTAARVQGFTVAGKTGTAKKPREGYRGYQDGAYVASFVGFLPAEAPRLSAIVVLDEPTPIFGGVVSAPVFSQLGGYGVRVFGIPPDGGVAQSGRPAAASSQQELPDAVVSTTSNPVPVPSARDTLERNPR
ncbi:MAG TPA: penicillin-binding protein 2 [Acidimicrobiales bacterium]|nr:penicillin-binding protein 2 [Acidimicrobiales bacterium]